MLEMYLKQIEHNIFQVHQIKSAFLDNVKLFFFVLMWSTCQDLSQFLVGLWNGQLRIFTYHPEVVSFDLALKMSLLLINQILTTVPKSPHVVTCMKYYLFSFFKFHSSPILFFFSVFLFDSLILNYFKNFIS